MWRKSSSALRTPPHVPYIKWFSETRESYFLYFEKYKKYNFMYLIVHCPGQKEPQKSNNEKWHNIPYSTFCPLIQKSVDKYWSWQLTAKYRYGGCTLRSWWQILWLAPREFHWPLQMCPLQHPSGKKKKKLFLITFWADQKPETDQGSSKSFHFGKSARKNGKIHSQNGNACGHHLRQGSFHKREVTQLRVKQKAHNH